MGVVLNRMNGIYGWLLVFCLACWASSGRAQQADARAILQQASEAFRRAGGVSASFTIRSSEGSSSGTIRLKGEKFVLEAGGMTTWFDGRTQWTYQPSSDEVNISEPTGEELQTLNPYVWLSLYDHGYDLSLLPSEAAGTYRVQMKAQSAEAQVETLILCLSKDGWKPLEFSLTLAGNMDPTVITVRSYRIGQAYPDAMFVFDRQSYPTAEIIDLR